MARKQMKGKKNERYYYNEHDLNQVNQLYRKRKKRRRKLRMKRVGLVLAIALVLGFIISPYSRVQTISIEGCEYIAKKDVLEMINVSERSFHVFVSTQKIEEKLIKNGIAKSVKCDKGLFSGLTIEIEESEPLAYQENEHDIYLLAQNGEIYTVSKETIAHMNIATRLLNFTDLELLKKFSEQYVNVPVSIRSLVSDISFAPIEPHDKEQIIFDMNDGKKVYIHELANLVSEMKYYQEILSVQPNACSYDIHGTNVYAKECE